MIPDEYSYRFFPQRYLDHAFHLTLFQDGCYRRLIDKYMTSRSPLPFDEVELAGICRISLKEWKDNFCDKILSCLKNGSSGWIVDFNECGVRLEPKLGRAPSSVWNDIRSRVFARDDYTCGYCGERGGELECDHKDPVSLGGGDEDTNLITSCFRCNRAKGDMPLEAWMSLIEGI